jgi:hypothetical protein
LFLFFLRLRRLPPSSSSLWSPDAPSGCFSASSWNSKALQVGQVCSNLSAVVMHSQQKVCPHWKLVVRNEAGAGQGTTHIADLWVDWGVIAQAASDILHRLAGLHLRQLLVYVELVSEPAPSETLILSVAPCVDLVLQLQPVRELAVHGGFPADLAELVPQVGKIFQGEVVLQDAFKKERVTNGLSEPGEIG